ncbi:tegument protein UL37 [Human betaherpesvirus 5]|uniref:Tegument protein UL37 n=1 Tax=Human cytomegalovirus TaxID=10359 RepID=A0A0G2U5V6_HCMV|nr:tegument protein UL37 [Human betaherpesvirus 5]
MMARRTVDFKKLIEQLRARATDKAEALNTVSQLEIGAVDAQDVTASAVRAFVGALPSSGYHFGFVRQNVVFYLLSHATVQTARDPLYAAEQLHEQLDRFLRHQHDGGGDEDRLPFYHNGATLTAFQKLLQTLREIQTVITEQSGGTAAAADLIASNNASTERRGKKGGSSSGGQQPLVRRVITQLETAATEARPYVNCRAVAELLDLTYQRLIYWVCTLMPYVLFRRDTDTELDTVLLMHFFYTHYRSVNGDLAVEFQNYVKNSVRHMSSFVSSDIDGDQKPGAEHMRDVSYKLFVGNLQARDASGLMFPIISTRISTVNLYLSPERMFFHPGLISRLLSEEVSPRANLDAYARVCDRVLEDHLHTPRRVQRLLDLTQMVTLLVELGFNHDTCAAYAQMALIQPASQKSSLFVSEIREKLIQIIYNFYTFFMCLYVYSPTFLFDHRRRLILEQHRSTLIGSKEELQHVWSNVTLNVNTHFAVQYTEEDFEAHTKGATEAEREYLYRDLHSKWGVHLFTLRPSRGAAGAASPLPPLDGVTRSDILRECALVNLNEGRVNYASLLAFSHHPEFPSIFAQLVVVTEFSEIFGIPQGLFQAVGSPRLFALIQLCRVLLPEQVTLYQNLVSIYNLTTFVKHIDAAVFKTVRDCVFDIATTLEHLSGVPVTPNVDLLAELMARSVAHNLYTTVNPLIEDVMRSSAGSLRNYLRHTRLCFGLARGRARLSEDGVTVYVEVQGQYGLRVPTTRFVEQLRELVRRDRLLAENLRGLNERLLSVRVRVRQISSDTEEVSRHAKGHRTVAQMSKALKKTASKIKVLETRVTLALEQAQRSNGAVVTAVQRALAVFDVLSRENLERRGAQLCLTEATSLLHRHRALAPMTWPAGTGVAAAAEADRALREFLEASWESAPQPPRLRMTPDTDHEESTAGATSVPEVLGARYEPAHLAASDLLNWYIVPVSQAQQDILSSIDPPAGSTSVSLPPASP